MSGIMSMVLGAKTAIAAAVDAYFNLVTLLLPGDGTNGAQNNTFLDSSTNNFSITRNGNTTQGTFTPFSQTGWSNFFDGTGDYFTWSGSAIGASQFSFECWFYHTGSFGSIQALLGPNSATNGGISVRIASSTQIKIDRLGVGESVFTVPTMSANTWYHLVACRGASNTTTVFLNGTRSSTGTITDSYSYGDAKSISYLNSSTPFEFTGYLSNVRLVVGSSAYDPTQSSITVPTAPLTAITDTKLLTCQSNRFVDNSSNAFAITVNGTPSVQAFSPFAPTAAYSAATNGGSGYFDGSGDYLTIARNTAFIPTTGDFTFEAWVYPLNTNAAIIAGLQETGTGADWNFFIASDSTIGLFAGNGSGQLNSTQTVKANQWNHCVASRSGSTLYIGCNGALTSGTFTNSLDNGQSYPLSIGADQNGDENNLTGYMSGLRLIKGSAQYTSTTYTVPTAPPTAITNTAVLLNYTNAGITDATAKNDLETVGGAQISTTQSKFGGSSIYLDGTGDYLRPNSGNIFNFGTGDFTVEFWLYLNSTAAQTFIDCRPGSAGDYILFDYDPTSKLRLYVGSTTVLSGSTLATGQWYHIALARSGSTVRYFINGTQGASATMTTNLLSAANPYIGCNYVPDAYVNGYIDDLRVTKGYARYTANFTAPTAAFPLQ